MKIAIVNRHPNDVIGGSELQCDNIALGLTHKGHDIIYVAPAGKKGADYNRPYRVLPVDSNSSAIAGAILAEKPDVVYWRLNKYHFYRAARRLAAAHIPIVFALSHINDTKWWSVHDNPRAGIKPFLKSVKQGARNAINHLGFRHVSGVTSMNPDFLNRLPIESQRFVPSSVDTTVKPFSWPRPFVVWVSNLKPAKQPEKFVELAKEIPGTDFLMVGAIQDETYNWVRDENVRTPNFHYLGAKTLHEVNGIMAQSLFLVHTCKPEGFPNTFLQAWFQKKPVVTLDFDAAGYIETHSLGFYAKGDWNAFVSETRRLIEDDATREAASTRAYDFAAANFSFGRTVDLLEGFLLEILAKKRAA